MAQHPSAAAWKMRGRALLGLQRYEELLAICDRALARNEDSTALWLRAQALYALGRPEEAKAAESRASFLER